MDRRGFLTAGLFAGLSAGLYQRAFAANTPPSERIRIGAIGIGGQGKGNLKAHAKNAVALCEVDSVRLAEAQKLVGHECFVTDDYRKLLERKDVDAVVITTPDHWHALQTIHACQAGKDVYVEKPMSLTIVEGRAMVKAAREHKRIVQNGSQQRSDAKFRLGCELVRNGRIGTIREVRVGLPGVNFKGPPVADGMVPAELNYDLWLGPAPMRPYNAKRVHYNFRFFYDYSGGQLTNWGAHHLDIAQWGLGMDESGPVKIEGTAKFNNDGVFEVAESFALVYTYANGVKIHCGTSEKNGTTFVGEKGKIFVNRGVLQADPPELLKDALPADAVHLYESKSHSGNWLDCIRTRKLPICDAEVGHRSATVCHLGNIALRTGRAIQWDPVKEEIVNDAEANKLITRTYRAPWTLGS
jgi:predicted dehydrogenase